MKPFFALISLVVAMTIGPTSGVNADYLPLTVYVTPIDSSEIYVHRERLVGTIKDLTKYLNSKRDLMLVADQREAQLTVTVTSVSDRNGDWEAGFEMIIPIGDERYPAIRGTDAPNRVGKTVYELIKGNRAQFAAIPIPISVLDRLQAYAEVKGPIPRSATIGAPRPSGVR